MTDIDPHKLFETLGELKQAMKTAAEQREEMMKSIKELRADQETQKIEHAKLVNRGIGLLVGVGAAAGTAGSAVKGLLFSGG